LSGGAPVWEMVDWLKRLGLQQYSRCFAENDIDVSILRDLDDSDLEKIGVASLGHRRKLLRAIADLTCLEGHTPTGGRTAVVPSSDGAPKDTAERRQVTVVFSDLVGSTALSTRMDPEDLREVISAYQTCVADTVRRFGGFVAKYMGDGVLVYFGYPHAHEDDPERAVRAGLEMVAAVSGLKTHAPLQTRVGIATGLVVVGDLIGSGASQEQAIVGETPNLAARLQGVAEPNSVVIAESTRRLVGSLFELNDLGSKEVKGIAGPVRAWAALRQASVESRFDALHASGLTELVGREEELALLLRRWSKAKTGEGQVVLLSGEPGIGKSRLTAALLEWLAAEPHTRLRYFCSPQHTDSAFYPIITQMERAARFAHDDTVQTKLNKLDGVLVQSSTPRQDAALFADMLSQPSDGRYPTLELTAQQRRQRTLEALMRQLEALSRTHPVLMIFEDIHWIDPTSLEALGRTVDRIRTLGVLLIITYRPELEPPWIGQPHVTALTLNRLGQRAIEAMIDHVAGNKLLPASVRQDIVERTDGIPLFVEEMTKALLEAGDQEAERAVAAFPSPSVAVPASLHASLMARLDRLGPAKEVAQIGAVIGREFSRPLLDAVARKPEAELQSALHELIEAGLLFRLGVPPHTTYLFKHALVQDTAYGTLLREPRRALHARIAETLESQFAKIAESQPELLARHYTEAGVTEKATRLWGKAGDRSLARSAFKEAAEQLSRAISQTATLPRTPASRREEIKLHAALRNVLVHLKGYAAPESKEALERARLLVEQAERQGEPPEDPLLLFSLLNGLWTANIVSFNGDAACGLAAEFLTRAKNQNAAGPIADGYRLVGTSSLMTGDIAGARAHFDNGIGLGDPIDRNTLVTSTGGDARVVMLGFRSVALWLLGYPKAARADSDQALSRAREITPVGTLMHTLSWTIFVQILCGHYMTATALVDELVALADEKDTAFWKAWGRMNKGWLVALTGKESDAVRVITSGLAAWRATEATMCVSFYLSCLATVYMQLSQFENAHRAINEAIKMTGKTSERWFEAEILRVAGEIALKSPKEGAVKAEAYFQHALSVARAQQAKSWELRTAVSLAQLRRDQGKRDEARDVLIPVYAQFAEGFDTRDLKEAKALLDELAQ
jgi:class 3 adenylate cyclase/tetratricopeptide (TPR) repeat protein